MHRSVIIGMLSMVLSLFDCLKTDSFSEAHDDTCSMPQAWLEWTVTGALTCTLDKQPTVASDAC